LAAALALALAVPLTSFRPKGELRLIVSVPSHTVSKLPVVIALAEDLYAKHGLRVEFWMTSPEPDAGPMVYADIWTWALRKVGISPKAPDIFVDGGTPMIVDVAQHGPAERQIVIGATDCVVRAHIVARREIERAEALKGKRLGVSAPHSTTGFQARVFAEKMGWDHVQDISILSGLGSVEDLAAGSVDAIVASETQYAEAKRAGFVAVMDMSVWDTAIAGNSIKVTPEWLKDANNREKAKRFLKATAEGIAVFHQRPDVARRVMRDWYGFEDGQYTHVVYQRGAWIPKKPYPCVSGIDETMRRYDSHEMRRYRPRDFYDDSLMREIDQSGFIDGLYGLKPMARLP
jgi:ABC-type nitrate/sulfonate/bicarbonate transport system substrate-binding protein